MGFERIIHLQSKISILNDSLSQYNSKLDVQRKRKDKIEKLIKNMKNVCDANCDDITDYIKKIVSSVEEALQGIKSSEEMKVNAAEDKEKDIYEDGKMNNALSQLESELKDVKNKITEYQSIISSTKSEICNCNVEIRKEQYVVASNYKNEYDNAKVRLIQAKAAYDKEPTSEYLRTKYEKAFQEKEVAKDNYYKYREWL